MSPGWKIRVSRPFWGVSALKVVTLTLQSGHSDPRKWSFWPFLEASLWARLALKIGKQASKMVKSKPKMKNFEVMVGVVEHWNRKMAVFRTSTTPFSIIFPKFSRGKPDRIIFSENFAILRYFTSCLIQSESPAWWVRQSHPVSVTHQKKETINNFC